MFFEKMTTREAAIERYGAIDLSSGMWPDAGKWLVNLDVSGLALPWTVMDSGLPVKHIVCNKDLSVPLVKALKAVKDQGLGDLIKTYDGCFNIRAVRGSMLVSTHAYGLGIDINAAENPLGASSGGFFDHPELIKYFTDQGMDWGGNFNWRKDGMHFSYAWE